MCDNKVVVLYASSLARNTIEIETVSWEPLCRWEASCPGPCSSKCGPISEVGDRLRQVNYRRM